LGGGSLGEDAVGGPELAAAGTDRGLDAAAAKNNEMAAEEIVRRTEDGGSGRVLVATVIRCQLELQLAG